MRGKLGDDPQAMEIMRSMEGKRLDQVDPDKAAMFVRAFDEAHNPRHYRSILPEGSYGDFIQTQKGEPAKVAWGTYGDIDKARRAILSGGDMDVISPLLGGKHKVRSFYNNIEVPFDTRSLGLGPAPRAVLDVWSSESLPVEAVHEQSDTARSVAPGSSVVRVSLEPHGCVLLRA